MTKVLGIDPGLASIGIGLVKVNGNDINYKASWLIKTSPHLSLAHRLAEIGRDIDLILQTAQPEEVAIEKLFWGKNVATCILVAQARGVIMGKLAGYKITEYAPSEIKRLATGRGHATKSDIKRHLEGWAPGVKDDNILDGIAIALAHARILVNTRSA
jgi:crossover junction endodeoxyribonuclease RuvC